MTEWWPSQDVHILIPRICEYVTLHGNRGSADGIKLRMGLLGLDYLGGPNTITGKEKGNFLLSESAGAGPAAKEGRQPPEAGKGKETGFLLEFLGGIQPCW